MQKYLLVEEKQKTTVNFDRKAATREGRFSRTWKGLLRMKKFDLDSWIECSSFNQAFCLIVRWCSYNPVLLVSFSWQEVDTNERPLKDNTLCLCFSLGLHGSHEWAVHTAAKTSGKSTTFASNTHLYWMKSKWYVWVVFFAWSDGLLMPSKLALSILFWKSSVRFTKL